MRPVMVMLIVLAGHIPILDNVVYDDGFLLRYRHPGNRNAKLSLLLEND